MGRAAGRVGQGVNGWELHLRSRHGRNVVAVCYIEVVGKAALELKVTHTPHLPFKVEQVLFFIPGFHLLLGFPSSELTLTLGFGIFLRKTRDIILQRLHRSIQHNHRDNDLRKHHLARLGPCACDTLRCAYTTRRLDSESHPTSGSAQGDDRATEEDGRIL
jgi:hypothetical protein